ncbi:MAG: SPOR domain-containing protein [Candidatus Cryptobacteroides sp.]
MKLFIRRAAMLAVLALAMTVRMTAQNVKGQDLDSLALSMSTMMDSTLVGKSIFSILPGSGKDGSQSVTVHQGDAVQKALGNHISANRDRKLSGYRVRIFSDNKQNARSASEAALATFKSMFPGCPAYRTYTNPFFKVTVGDFRTKSEAMLLLQQVKGTFPTAFIVPETINYPALNKSVVFNSINTGN